MRSIDATLKARLLQAQQTLYNNANPTMDVEVIRPRTAIFHKRFWQETIVTAGVTADRTSVAVRRMTRLADRVYVAYVSGGTLTVKSATLVFPISQIDWTIETTIPNCLACSLEFDGRFESGVQKTVEYYTEETPWLFYITTAGQLKAGLLGGPYQTIVGANVTAMDAIRGVRGLMGTNHGIDEGMCVFYILNSTVYYRQLRYGEWEGQQEVDIAPANAVLIRAERTFDWRIVLQVQDNLGALYEVFTWAYVSGNTNIEFITAKVTEFTIAVTELTYHDAKLTDEYITAGSTMEVFAKSVTSPIMVSAWNIPTSKFNEDLQEWYADYGFRVVLKWSDAVFELDANLSSIRLVDEYNTQWTAQEIIRDELHNRLILRFSDFNNASGVCSIVYTPGTLSSGVVPVDADSVAFTPINLVPTFVPAPLFVSAWNTDNQTVIVEFDRAIVSIVTPGITVTGQEPNMSPLGEMFPESYAISGVAHADPQPLYDEKFISGTFTATSDTAFGLMLKKVGG